MKNIKERTDKVIKTLQKCSFVLVFASSFSHAQTSNDSTTTSILITSYPFSYNTYFLQGTFAIGPSFSIKQNKTSFQVGVLCDTKRYIYYEHVAHAQTDTIKAINLILPVLISYDIHLSKAANYFITGGIAFGGRYYLEHNSTVRASTGLNVVIGAGVSFSFLKEFKIKLYPNLRYNGQLFPGFFIDLSL